MGLAVDTLFLKFMQYQCVVQLSGNKTSVPMNPTDSFPEKISVTDQILDISSFPVEWKSKIADLGKLIFVTYKKSNQKRFIVAFAGPSGSGKSTNAAVIEHFLNKQQSNVRIVSVSLDGYHYDKKYLEETLDASGEPLIKHKGREDSFDVVSLTNDLNSFRNGKEVVFPLYSRKIHNPIARGVTCKEGEPVLLILEGLWLLYDKKPWNELLSLYDFKIFFHAPDEVLKQNTIARHIRGERSSAESESFYEQSDAVNKKLIQENIVQHDTDFYYL